MITALATPTGLEPATSAVTGRRANQLRYGALTDPGALVGRPRNYSAVLLGRSNGQDRVRVGLDFAGANGWRPGSRRTFTL